MFYGIVALLALGAWAVASEVSSGSDSPAAPGAPPIDTWRRFDHLYKKYAAIYGLDWKWLKAIALNESSNGLEKSVAEGLRNPTNVQGSKSQDGKSWGLMQVTISTARTMDPAATEIKLNDPEYSISLAAKYLGQIIPRELQKYGNISILELRYREWQIKAYNQGAGNSIKNRNGVPTNQTEQQRKDVEAYWQRWLRNLAEVEKRP